MNSASLPSLIANALDDELDETDLGWGYRYGQCHPSEQKILDRLAELASQPGGSGLTAARQMFGVDVLDGAENDSPAGPIARWPDDPTNSPSARSGPYGGRFATGVLPRFLHPNK